MLPSLWKAINSEIEIAECELFSFNADADCEPFNEDGSLWSFTFFFYNKRLNRIVFLFCQSTRLSYLIL